MDWCVNGLETYAGVLTAFNNTIPCKSCLTFPPTPHLESNVQLLSSMPGSQVFEKSFSHVRSVEVVLEVRVLQIVVLKGVSALTRQSWAEFVASSRYHHGLTESGRNQNSASRAEFNPRGQSTDHIAISFFFFFFFFFFFVRRILGSCKNYFFSLAFSPRMRDASIHVHEVRAVNIESRMRPAPYVRYKYREVSRCTVRKIRGKPIIMAASSFNRSMTCEELCSLLQDQGLNEVDLDKIKGTFL